MSDEEVLAGDLQQTVRVLATIGGQMAERLARLRADQARNDQLKSQEQTRSTADQLRSEQQDVERRRRDDIGAARTVYGGVREDRFWRDDDRLQVRAGEALTVSAAMSPHDPLATTAHDYLRREIDHRQDEDAQAWTQAALAALSEATEALLRDAELHPAMRHPPVTPAHSGLARSVRLLVQASSRHEALGWVAVLEQLGHTVGAIAEARRAQQEAEAAGYLEARTSAALVAVQGQLRAVAPSATETALNSPTTGQTVSGPPDSRRPLGSQRPPGTHRSDGASQPGSGVELGDGR